MRRIVRLALLLGLGLSFAGGAQAEVYKWIDENGIAHFTTDPKQIPEHLGDELRSLEDGRPPRDPEAEVLVRIPPPVLPAHGVEPLSMIPPPSEGSAPMPALIPPPVRRAEPDPLDSIPAPAPSAASELSMIPPPASVTSGPDPLSAIPAPAAGGDGEDPLYAIPPPTEPTAPRAPETPPVEAAPPPASPREAEIRQLEQQIATDREELLELISRQRAGGGELAADPRMREIAERLPRLQSELDALRGEREP